MTAARDDRPRGRFLSAYRSRETAYPEPRPLRVGDGEMRVLDDRAAALARPSNAADRTGIPNRKPVRALREPDLEPRPGEGVLSILVDGGDTAPVIAVDGVPVSVGNGQLDLVLRAGTHTVEAQNTHTIDPVVVRVEPGGRHGLQCFEDRITGHRVLGDPPETYAFIPTSAGCWAWLVLVALVCGLPYSLVAWLQPPLVVSAVATGAISVALIATCVPLHRRSSAEYHRRIAEQRPVLAREPVPYGSDAILLGARPTATPPIPVGAAAIDLHLVCGRHLWAGHRKSSTGSFLARAWTRPPRVIIDGAEAPAAWGHWRYHVPPGTHQVAVIADGRPLNLDVPDRHTGETVNRRDLVVETRSGQAVPLKAEAHVYAVWRSSTGEVESFQPRLRLESDD